MFMFIFFVAFFKYHCRLCDIIIPYTLHYTKSYYYPSYFTLHTNVTYIFHFQAFTITTVP